MADAAAAAAAGGPLLLGALCAICRARPPRYTCPRCRARTCSLACARRHKAWAACSGRRDATAYVARAALATPAGIDHDYNFLSAIERRVARAEREIVDERRLVARAELRAGVAAEERAAAGPSGGGRGRGARGRGRGSTRRAGAGAGAAAGARAAEKRGEAPLARAMRARGVRVERAPRGMRRASDNGTSWSRKQRCVSWQVEWVVVEEEGGGEADHEHEHEKDHEHDRRHGQDRAEQRQKIRDGVTPRAKMTTPTPATTRRLLSKALDRKALGQCLDEALEEERRTKLGEEGRRREKRRRAEDHLGAAREGAAKRARREGCSPVAESAAGAAAGDAASSSLSSATPIMVAATACLQDAASTTWEIRIPGLTGWAGGSVGGSSSAGANQGPDGGRVSSSSEAAAAAAASYPGHYLYLHRPHTPADQPTVLIPLSERQASLGSCLETRTLLEFPTVYVLPWPPGGLAAGGYVTEGEYLAEVKRGVGRGGRAVGGGRAAGGLVEYGPESESEDEDEVRSAGGEGAAEEEEDSEGSDSVSSSSSSGSSAEEDDEEVGGVERGDIIESDGTSSEGSDTE